MKLNRFIAGLLVTAAVAATTQAQVLTQELYQVKFKATCRPADNADGRSSKMTDRDLIEECVGTGFSRKELKRDFALIYNPAADRLQVVSRTDGSLLCDALIFEGGTNVVAGDQLTRFTFVFHPNQSEAIGSAVITERIQKNNRRARIVGKIQFTRSVHSAVESAAVTSTETAETNIGDSSNGDSGVNPRNPQDNSNSDSSNTNNVGNDSDNPEDNRRDRDDGRNGVGDGGGVGENDAFVQSRAAAQTASNVEVCTGTFTAGKLFELGRGSGRDDDDVDQSGSQGGGASTNDANSAIDQRFVNRATQAGLLEIELGNLAQQNSTNQDVIAYGQRLVQEHTTGNQRLAQLAADDGFTVPTTVDVSGQNTINRLGRLEGDSFDRAFLTEAISSHRESITLYQNEAARGRDEEIRTFAAETLPELQEHLTEAQTLRTGL